jgi:hypothetical protein
MTTIPVDWTGEMPVNAKHIALWRRRAASLRREAARCQDERMRRALRLIADAYDDFAELAQDELRARRAIKPDRA